MKPRLKQILVEAGTQPGQLLQLNAGGTAFVAGLRFTASPNAAPANTDDSGEGYAPGSLWVRLDTNEAWICLDATVDNAVWAEIGLGGNPVQEPQATENISGTDTTLAAAFSKEPISDASVRAWLNGVLQEQGATKDYTVDHTASPPSIKWLQSTGTAVPMDTNDVLIIAYESYA